MMPCLLNSESFSKLNTSPTDMPLSSHLLSIAFCNLSALNPMTGCLFAAERIGASLAAPPVAANNGSSRLSAFTAM